MQQHIKKNIKHNIYYALNNEIFYLIQIVKYNWDEKLTAIFFLNT